VRAFAGPVVLLELCMPFVKKLRRLFVFFREESIGRHLLELFALFAGQELLFLNVVDERRHSNGPCNDGNA